jgi:hypothetical protein
VTAWRAATGRTSATIIGLAAGCCASGAARACACAVTAAPACAVAAGLVERLDATRQGAAGLPEKVARECVSCVLLRRRSVWRSGAAPADARTRRDPWRPHTAAACSRASKERRRGGATMHRTRASALTRCCVKNTACRRHARGLWCSYLRPARAARACSPSGRSARLGAAPYTRPSARTTEHERDGDVGTQASASHVVFQSGRIAHACVAHRASGCDVGAAR